MSAQDKPRESLAPIPQRKISLEGLRAASASQQRGLAPLLQKDSIELEFRSLLMTALQDHIAREGLTQAGAAELFGVTKGRISKLLRGETLFQAGQLLDMVASAELRIEMRLAREV